MRVMSMFLHIEYGSPGHTGHPQHLLLCISSVSMQDQQNPVLHRSHRICGQPLFFSIRTPHFGHGLTSERKRYIVARAVLILAFAFMPRLLTTEASFHVAICALQLLLSTLLSDFFLTSKLRTADQIWVIVYFARQLESIQPCLLLWI